MKLKTALFLLALSAPLSAPVATAHPHIFVDASLALRIDDRGQLLGIEITWSYDEYYSLLIFEDRALDSDFDGALTEAELGQLAGFDLQWSEGFQGDTFVTRAEAPVLLGAPDHLETRVSDGRITTRHFRPLTSVQPADGLVIQSYDPTYYTAYTVAERVTFTQPAPCQAKVAPPNLDRAYTLVEETLYAMSAKEAEETYPQVGRSFADTVYLSCSK